MACPVCFKNLKKFSVSRKLPCFQKPNNGTGTHTALQLSIKSTLLCQFLPYPGTAHRTVQVRVRVPGADLPHIYMGFKTHIYTRLVEPDKTGLSPRQV